MVIAVGQTSKGRSGAAATVATAGVTTQATGSTFVLGVTWGAGAAFTSVVDSKGNTYTQVGGLDLDPDGTGSHTRFYYCQNGVGGASHTATLTIGAANNLEILFLEITGAAIASFDLGNGNADTASPYTTPSIATTQAAEMLVAFFAGNSGSNPATHAESTGFSVQTGAEETNGASFWTGCLATRIVAATGSYNASFTETGSTRGTAFIASFKEAAAGAGAQRGLGPGGGPRKNRLRSTRSFESVAVAADLTLALTGVAGTGATGTLTPSTAVPLTGNAGTGQIGTVVPSRTVPLTGVAGAGATGTAAPGTTLALTGNSATGQVGNVTPSLSVAITGVAATGQVGTLAPSTTIGLTGVQATGQVGNVSTSGDLTLALTGIAATGAVGTLTPATSVPVTGVSATSAVGSVAPALSLATTGAAATGQVGTPNAGTSVPISGNSATGQVGTVTVASSDVTIALTGVSASGQVGTLVPSGMDVASTTSSPAGGSSSFERPQTHQQKRRTEKKLEDDIRRIYRRLTNTEPEIAAAIVEPITSPPAKKSSKAAEVEHRAAQITLSRIGVDAEIALRLAEKELETKRAQRAENLRRIALILQLVV